MPSRCPQPFALTLDPEHLGRHTGRRVQPREASRGEIARAMLNMADRYDLKLFRRQRELLMKWHREDPATEAERERNNRIRQLQGNNNRYISRN